jgi:predicted GNAT family acetyltransferase
MRLPLLAELRTRGRGVARRMAAEALENAECGVRNVE